jgi:glycosyltransferase involved in cell wall biosynthesis
MKLYAKPASVLYCIDCLVRGGTELQLLSLIDRLDRCKYAPHLLTIRPSNRALVPAHCPHLDWHVPKLLTPGGVRSALELACWLRRHRIKVVHTFFQDSTVLAGVAARMAGVPVRLVSFRDMGSWHTRAQILLMRRIYPLMTGYLCNSDAVRDHFVAQDGIDPCRTRVVRNGVDVSALPWIEQNGPTLHVGIVGNLTRRVKRTDLFLRAAGIVAREHPEIAWHVIGDGHLRRELEDLARTERIAERTLFTGRIEDVAGYLERLQIGVICSDSEGLSNALLEYMFKGVTAVATNVGGNPELIADGETGLLVPPDNAEALAAALTRLIRDDVRRRQLAVGARRRVEASYSWEKCLAAHDEIYTRLLNRARSGG